MFPELMRALLWLEREDVFDDVSDFRASKLS